MRLLEDPQLIQIELDRRLQAARRADPAKRREEALRRDLLRIHKSIERLLTAYQEDLISFDELRQRMPDLRMREQTSEAELQAIADQSAERAACLRLAETVADFSLPSALIGRNAQRSGASACRSTAGQRNLRRRRQNCDPTLDSTSGQPTWRPLSERGFTGARPRPVRKLSFAFRA